MEDEGVIVVPCIEDRAAIVDERSGTSACYAIQEKAPRASLRRSWAAIRRRRWPPAATPQRARQIDIL